MKPLINALVLDNPEGPAFSRETDQIQFGKFQKVNVTSDNPKDQIDLQNLYLPSVTVKKFEGTMDRDTVLINKNNVGSDLVGFCFFLKGGLTSYVPYSYDASNITGGDQKFKYDPDSEMSHLIKANQQLEFIHISVQPNHFLDLLPSGEHWSDELGEKIQRKQLVFKETTTSICLLQQMALQNIKLNLYDGKLGMLMLESSVTQAIVGLMEQSFRKENAVAIKLNRRDSDLMHEIRNYILQTFLHPHSLSCLARHFGINQTKLISGFKSAFGTSIFEYICGLKLQHAKKLLEEDGLFVQEVASILGYKNPNHFSAAFKKKFGISPSVLKG
jgi:AraC-like DNA-binding protein